SITYRGNLARLAETLLNEGKNEKAKKVLDLAMEHMPVEYFQYYSLLEPFVIGYYQIGEVERARDIYNKVSKKYQEKSVYYSGLKVRRQYPIASEIITTMERYRGLIDVLIMYDGEALARAEAEKFNEHIMLFQHFYSPEEGVDVNKKLQKEDTVPLLKDTMVQHNTAIERAQ
ncbi:MAG: hypothetical protein ACPGU0_08105, partial [Marinirhabdus sp.]